MFWIFIDVGALWCFLGTSRGTGRITRQAFEDPEGGLLVGTSENWWIEEFIEWLGMYTAHRHPATVENKKIHGCPYQKK